MSFKFLLEDFKSVFKKEFPFCIFVILKIVANFL